MTTKKAKAPQELVMLHDYLNMELDEQGRELARMYPPPDVEDPEAFAEGMSRLEAKYFAEQTMRQQHVADDPYVPSFVYLSSPEMLPDDWLAHFTDSGNAIAAHGFQHGMDNPYHLALTSWFKQEVKSRPGYGFAFALADATRAGGHDGTRSHYGREVVLFRAFGVRAYHLGDDEHQVIFWQPQAHDIMRAFVDDGRWIVYGDDGEVLAREETAGTLADWLDANRRKWRRRLKVARNPGVPRRRRR